MRIDGVEEAATRAWLGESAARMAELVDDTHHTFLEDYLARAHALHALGEPSEEVLRALWRAARTYRAHFELFLARWPPERVKSRRLVPFELALVVGDGEVLATLAEKGPLDMFVLLAGTGSLALEREVRSLSDWFATRTLSGQTELLGTLALCYASALWALAAGQIDALRAAIDVSRALSTQVPASAIGTLARVSSVHRALGSLSPPRPEALAAAVLEQHRHHQESYAQAPAEERARGLGSLDLTSLALVAAGAAVGCDATPVLAAAAPDPLRRYLGV